MSPHLFLGEDCAITCTHPDPDPGSTVALATLTAAPAAHAAASGCTHNWSGPQICIETTGESGNVHPGTITATWTNPPKSRNKATVYITNWAHAAPTR